MLRQAGLVAGFRSDHSFGDFLHGFTLLTALAAEHELGLFFAEASLALQDAFSAFDDLSCFEFFGEL